MSFATPNVLPNFNEALNRCKADGSEEELARLLGCTARSLYNWRRNKFPPILYQLARCPEALAALALDLNALSKYTLEVPEKSQ
jgi:hypothetical protein